MLLFFHLPGPAHPRSAPHTTGRSRTAPVTCERAAAPGPPSGASLGQPCSKRRPRVLDGRYALLTNRTCSAEQSSVGRIQPTRSGTVLDSHDVAARTLHPAIHASRAGITSLPHGAGRPTRVSYPPFPAIAIAVDVHITHPSDPPPGERSPSQI
ncbi:hypothetical protein SCLCIDRAFT_31578 [Scleroderma citrinum Foug A]|uniref:Uncharacterized protein n=1 Tax=Scleroderma citrinum Foug A TaxID=1036808 RepID=A0A0C3CZ49_9AGAM|nr:hypothetical protein SCLCIDRAFT_31578 [Scleroderma citrinum Foug A]